MSSKIGLNLTKHYSINFSLPKRKPKTIKFIILHYTGMKKETKAIQKLCNYTSKVSSHYFIKNSGEVLNLVPDIFEAWHAGKSKWDKYSMLNKYSIGIEIQNSGHDHFNENYKIAQIHSLRKLIKKLINEYRINLKNILGHSDISPDRKKDPGEKFPWKILAKSHLANWHNLNENKLKKKRLIRLNSVEEKEFFRNLYKIGYNKTKSSKSNYNKRVLTISFQRRFRQNLVNGIIDKECLFISRNIF